MPRPLFGLYTSPPTWRMVYSTWLYGTWLLFKSLSSPLCTSSISHAQIAICYFLHNLSRALHVTWPCLFLIPLDPWQVVLCFIRSYCNVTKYKVTWLLAVQCQWLLISWINVKWFLISWFNVKLFIIPSFNANYCLSRGSMSSDFLSRGSMSSVSYPVVQCHVISYPVVQFQVFSYPVVQCQVISFPVVQFQVIFSSRGSMLRDSLYLVVQCHNIPYTLILCQVTP